MAKATYRSRLALLAIACLVCGLLGLRCLVARGVVLEYDEVLEYKLALNAATKLPEAISGLCGRSAYCVHGITVKADKGTAVVLVKIGLCDKGQTGSFSHPLRLGNDIRELRFGTKETLLWSRSRGEIKSQPPNPHTP